MAEDFLLPLGSTKAHADSQVQFAKGLVGVCPEGGGPNSLRPCGNFRGLWKNQGDGLVRGERLIHQLHSCMQ